jgi:hypothetical protein
MQNTLFLEDSRSLTEVVVDEEAIPEEEKLFTYTVQISAVSIELQS